MQIAHLLLAGALALAATAAQADIYKWTDEQGRVHYGDRPSPSAPAAERRELQVPELPEAQRQEAIERLEKQRATLKAPAGEAGVISAPAAEARPAERDDSCAAQMRRYHQSQECFAPFRNVNGSVKPEAFRYCKDIPEPQCD